MIGEHYVGVKRIIRRILLTLIKEKKLVTAFHDLFPPDADSGDHYYRLSDYEFMFRTMGYRLEHQILRNGNVMYVAKKLPQILNDLKGVG